MLTVTAGFVKVVTTTLGRGPTQLCIMRNRSLKIWYIQLSCIAHQPSEFGGHKHGQYLQT